MALIKQIFKLVIYDYFLNMPFWQKLLLYSFIGIIVGGIANYLYFKNSEVDESTFMCISIGCWLAWPVFIICYILYYGPKSVFEFIKYICDKHNSIQKEQRKATYSALEIAQYIIHHEAQKGDSVNNLRLQKLLYFVQAQFLVNSSNRKPCFKERMEAWDSGPAVPVVYREYQSYGNAVIPYDNCKSVSISDEDKKLIDEMLDLCGNFSTPKLTVIAHAQSPWKNAYRNNFDNEITQEAIQSYFTNK